MGFILATMRGVVFRCLVLAALLVLASPATAQSPAAEVVERLHDTLLEVMKQADALGFDGRRERLAPVFADSYDMALVARVSTGRHWRRADPAQQATMIDALTRLSVAIYASRFDGYSGESFRVLSTQPAPRKTVLVNSEIVKSDGDAVRLNYRVREGDAGWRIVDVYLKGIYSELATRRSDYAAVLERGGFDALLAAIDKKIAKLRAGG